MGALGALNEASVSFWNEIDWGALLSALLGGLLALLGTVVTLTSQNESKREDRIWEATVRSREASLRLDTALTSGDSASVLGALEVFRDSMFTLEGLLWRWRGRDKARRGFGFTVRDLTSRLVDVGQAGDAASRVAASHLARAVALACADFESNPRKYSSGESRAKELFQAIGEP